jgi:hypothetical protein
MERPFEEWFVALDELKGVCDAVEVGRIRALTDRSDYLLDAIGGLEPPRPKLCEQRADSHVAPNIRRATRGSRGDCRALFGHSAAGQWLLS